jgi:hypothetical protein
LKNKNVFLIISLLSTMLLIPVVNADVVPFGELPYRSITVDGNIGDWDGIAPLVQDSVDEPGASPSEDIKEVYGANDDDNLYFLMILDSVEVTANPYTTTYYYFYIDNIPEAGDPTEGNADYAIKYYNGVTSLCKYSAWGQVECLGVQGVMNGYYIEVCVPWECLGGKDCFNCFFKAEGDVPGTDYAPDEDLGIILLGCCPGEEPEPVGGEIIPLNILQYIVFLVTMTSIGVMVARNKKIT